jgi:hypothetical protein
LVGFYINRLFQIQDYAGLDKLLSFAVDYLDQRVLEDYQKELKHRERDKIIKAN